MKGICHFNSAHLQYLTPLLKWRVMDLQSLLKECCFKKNYFNFAKIIRNLEKLKIIHGYKHPFNKRKYIYFSSEGEKLLGGEHNPTAICEESLIHDIKVSELSRNLLEIDSVNRVILEHQLHNKGEFYARRGLVPDAVIEVRKRNSSFRIALELELTQKCKVRITEKAKQYLIHHSYDQIIYFFASESLMNSYKKKIQSIFPNGTNNKILFFYNEDLTRSSNCLEEAKGMYNGELTYLKEFFERIEHS